MVKVLKWETIIGSGLIGLAAIVAIIIGVSCGGNGVDDGQPQVSEPTSTPVPMIAPTATAMPTVAPTPTAVPTTAITPTVSLTKTCVEPTTPDLTSLLTELLSCKPDLSRSSRETIRLFIELHQFNDDPEFHQVGFDACCRFNSWKEEVDSLRDTSGVSTIGEIGIVPGDLLTIGLEYLGSAGQPTEFTKTMQATMESAVRKSMGFSTVQPMPTANPSLGSEVIGEWENEYIPGVKSRITIFSEAGQLNLKESYSDGSELIQSLVESDSSAGRRFNLAEGSDGYFVIDAEGNLEIWGSSGLLYTAKKLE